MSIAPFPKRLYALIIDLSIFGFVFMIIAYVLIRTSLVGTALSPEELVRQASISLGGIIWAVFIVSYNTFFLARYGQTFGKMILRIRVVDQQGKAISFIQALIRQSVIIAYTLISLVVSRQETSTALGLIQTFANLTLITDYAGSLFDNNRLTLHDRIANTKVTNIN